MEEVLRQQLVRLDAERLPGHLLAPITQEEAFLLQVEQFVGFPDDLERRGPELCARREVADDQSEDGQRDGRDGEEADGKFASLLGGLELGDLLLRDCRAAVVEECRGGRGFQMAGGLKGRNNRAQGGALGLEAWKRSAG